MRAAALAAKILIAHRAGQDLMIFEILLQILMQELKQNWYQEPRVKTLGIPSC